MNGYKSAWEGASEGINSGIDNALKLYSAKNAQEDQAYKQSLRQRGEAEYAERMAPIGTPESLATQYGWDDESRNKMLGIMESRGFPRGTPIRRYQGDDLLNVLGVNEKKDLANMRTKFLDQQMKQKTSILGKLDKNSPAYSGLQSELDTLSMEYGGLTAGLRQIKYQEAEEARKQAEEKRTEEMFPLEKRKAEADIGRTRALTAGGGRMTAAGGGGMTQAKNVDTVLKQGDDIRSAIIERIKNSTDKQETTVLNNSLGKLQGHINYDINEIKNGRQPSSLTEFTRWFSDIRGYKPNTQNQQPKAEGLAGVQTSTPSKPTHKKPLNAYGY
jgi:hypothetical protein